MKISIIREDGAVYKDGNAFIGLDLSDIPSNVHALQFNDVSNMGWLEFVEDDFGNKISNEPITSLPEWASNSLIKWEEAKIAWEAEMAAAHKQPHTTGTLPA